MIFSPFKTTKSSVNILLKWHSKIRLEAHFLSNLNIWPQLHSNLRLEAHFHSNLNILEKLMLSI